MAKYLISVSYSADGLKGLFKDKASGRLAAVRQTVEGLEAKSIARITRSARTMSC